MGFSQPLPRRNRWTSHTGLSRVFQFRPHLEYLEERSLFNCTSMDPFICTPLPAGNNYVEFHPYLSIFINGQPQTIPANIGVNLDKSGNVISFLPVHTRENTGKLEVDSPFVRYFHLQDFFDSWGQPFDSTHILGYHTSPDHPLHMTVGAQPRTDYGSFVLHDGQDIVITAVNAVLDNPVPVVPAPVNPVTVNPSPVSSAPANPVAVNPMPVSPGPRSMSSVSGVPNQSPSSEPSRVAIGNGNGDSIPDAVTAAALQASHLMSVNRPAIAAGTSVAANPDSRLLDQFFANDSSSSSSASVGAADVGTGSTIGSVNYHVIEGNVGGMTSASVNGIDGTAQPIEGEISL